MLVLASVSDRLVDFAVNVIGDLGLFGVYVLTVLESACIPIPSEATMMFAGFNVADGKFPLWAAVAVAVAGELTGSLIAYSVGYFGRVDLIEKHGRKVLIKPHHLKWADDWFARYGDATVFFSRMLPIIRTFISLPAGIAKMPFWRFSVLTVLGSIPWVFMLALIGREAGDRWERWKEHLHYVDYVVIAAIVVGVAWLLARYVRRRRDGARPADATSV
jgi:membrane protein DedA with SNARE-associated domain